MNTYRITLLAGSSQTKTILSKQLKQLFGDILTVDAFAIDEELPSSLNSRTVIVSSMQAKKEIPAILLSGASVIVANRMPDHQHLDKLLAIPAETKALVVNDSYQSAQDTISTLTQLGITHIEYIPYQKGHPVPSGISLAISPGEMDSVPETVQDKIDIGVRLLDYSTIFEILYSLNMTDLAEMISQRYLRNLISLHQDLLLAEVTANKLRLHLQHVVDAVDDSVIAVSKDHTISVLNDGAKMLLNLEEEYSPVGKPLQEILQDDAVANFILHGEEENEFHTLNGIDVMIHRYVLETEGTCVATIKTVRQAIEIEQSARKELAQNGLVAKYTFEHIKGRHPLIQDVVKIAKKLAMSELPVLIQGATGTGKELFAHSIHTYSSRKNGPFLAVNCSALPETLLESELFGYEEGTFTGAQKGGRKGLFELANGGTIFLDEIGDISQSLQARLLRVLQEKEIRRTGGHKLIPIDTRVISATNNNLLEKVSHQEFRADLYYRLNVLSLQIPELKDRKSDIPLLIQHFIELSGRMVRVDPAAEKALLQYDWPGNIRELKNSIDYMLAVCDGRTIQLHDIPNRHLEKPAKKKTSKTNDIQLTVMDKEQYLFILQSINKANEEGEPASRRMIAEMSKTTRIPLTAQQVRHRLDFLEKSHYVTKGRGRAGTKITVEGLDFLNSLTDYMQ
ncbi:AAA domain-containing protein [Bacillus lacus]|uniref:AAA domain-containing protein n=1 Tax=Metabacillus lacus TaxID=1983721 RepID=A0A7X2IWH5_9BACI|nr:sigma 54-interacting transcriptional regulator [Metabacillus lacus]MRX70900.1 AAA domain-containing protein [Metabacillus lacus]